MTENSSMTIIGWISDRVTNWLGNWVFVWKVHKVVLMPSAYGVVGGCKNGVKMVFTLCKVGSWENRTWMAVLMLV